MISCRLLSVDKDCNLTSAEIEQLQRYDCIPIETVTDADGTVCTSSNLFGQILDFVKGRFDEFSVDFLRHRGVYRPMIF